MLTQLYPCPAENFLHILFFPANHFVFLASVKCKNRNMLE